MINLNNKSMDKKRESKREEKILAKNTFYSLLTSSSNFFFSIITVFFIARLISKDEWSLLILVTSLISIFTLILVFLPPSAGLSVIYYASKFKALNQNNKLKSFIKNSLILRIGFTLIIYFLNISIFWYFRDFFSLNQSEYIYIFYLLSPLIIINGIAQITDSIAQSLNLFRLIYLWLVIKNVIYIGGLIYLYFFFDYTKVYNIAIILLFSILIPFILNFTLIIILVKFRIKKTDEEGESLKETFKKIYKYGSYLTILHFTGTFYNEMTTQQVGFYETKSLVTGYHIANRYNSIPTLAILSFSRPLTIYYIRLISKKQTGKIRRIYNLLFNYSLILFLLITGILFFTVDIFLFVLYGESYLSFSVILKLCLFIPIFTIQDSFVGSYFLASNKVKQISFISLANGLFKLTLFAIGIIFFKIIGAVIFLIIANLIIMVIYTLILRKLNVKLKIRTPLIILLLFFISLFTPLLINTLFLNEIYLYILKNLNLSFFQYFSLPSLWIYFMIFLSSMIVFKIFTKSDIEKIESIFSKDNFSHRLIRIGLKISKKFVRA